MDRRAFLTAIAAGWLVQHRPDAQPIPGRIVGASHAAGHWLRDGGLDLSRAPVTTEHADVVIVGAGVSGLSAAWRLRASGLGALVLELEPFAGGTSTWGDDGAAPHPWGAHYLAAPNPEARAALRLLEELGVVTGWDAAGQPRFDPRVLCHAPQERLFYRGQWHEGLTPVEALTPADEAELTRFSAFEATMTEAIGADGRPAFQIPLELSSRDPDLLALDRMTMAEWLERQGYRTPFVRWTTRYAMLDDFGGLPEDVSAWAGLHYFASRKLRSAELEGSHFLVWPEGNGRLVRGLLDLGAPSVRTGALVVSVMPAPARAGVEVVYADVATRELHRVEARGAILATPAIVARRLLGSGAHRDLPVRAASPWLVANLHVRRPIDPDMSWDSVLYDAEGLGYVDARHQLTELRERTVLTYYRAYGSAEVAQTRGELARARWSDLADAVIADLRPAHPHLRDEIERMDLMVWGHGMPRPRPGFLGSKPFDVACALDDAIAWAHVDQSGMALFEEAQLRGVRAAEVIARAVGARVGETWI